MNNTFRQIRLAMIVAVGLASLIGCRSGSLTGDSHDDAENSILKEFPPYAQDPEGNTETVRVSVRELGSGLRAFTLTSTQDQRDDKPKKRVVEEKSNLPRVVSSDLLFDGLFALAVDDMVLDSVSDIRDGSYNNGESIPCDCFETGEKWNYVWTRDLAYAADLSLVYFDPQRVANSMLFKTSAFRDSVEAPDNLPANSTQIIQDTGSGGSWPVSTDRVSWSIAAESLIDQLSGAARTEFIEQAYAALRGTVEADRAAAFDARDGLYGGEQSFLDWRVQTYAPWITNNLSRMSESKALSTNVAHYQALKLSARLAQNNNDSELAQKYSSWAEALKQSINAKFWLEDVGLYSSVTSGSEGQVPVYKYDMLGTALAIQHGVASLAQAERVMANYPHAEYGVPVYYPHQPNINVYHNRAIWPFVTAYALRAGVHAGNDKVVNNAVHSLMRGAALNLSNMENLEWLTAKPWYDDGPTINSRRQLWSVAAYLSMVTETVFGYRPEAEGFAVRPFLTGQIRTLLGHSDIATLENLEYKGKTVTINLQLPEETELEGVHAVQSVDLNGTRVSGPITEAMLNSEGNTVTVHFGELKQQSSEITMVPSVNPLSHTDPRVFSPAAPIMDSIHVESGQATIAFTDEANDQVTDDSVYYNIYRNGARVVSGMETYSWTDPQTLNENQRYCYSVEAVFNHSGNRSQHSEPRCYEEPVLQVIPVTSPDVSSNLDVTPASTSLVKPTLKEWGHPDDQLIVDNVRIEQAGQYALRTEYNNRQHTIDSGVTAAVKQLIVRDFNGGEVARGIIQMPNVEDRNGHYPLRLSTEMIVDLPAGNYRLEMADYFNMSYLQSNASYTGSGGQTGPVNKSSIAEFHIVRIGD